MYWEIDFADIGTLTDAPTPEKKVDSDVFA